MRHDPSKVIGFMSWVLRGESGVTGPNYPLSNAMHNIPIAYVLSSLPSKHATVIVNGVLSPESVGIMTQIIGIGPVDSHFVVVRARRLKESCADG
jgi:hypothetical protein